MNWYKKSQTLVPDGHGNSVDSNKVHQPTVPTPQQPALPTDPEKVQKGKEDYSKLRYGDLIKKVPQIEAMVNWLKQALHFKEKKGLSPAGEQQIVEVQNNLSGALKNLGYDKNNSSEILSVLP